MYANEEKFPFLLGSGRLGIKSKDAWIYSLHLFFIAIFQKLKCSKMIAIFTISMGIGNK